MESDEETAFKSAFKLNNSHVEEWDWQSILLFDTGTMICTSLTRALLSHGAQVACVQLYVTWIAASLNKGEATEPL